MGILTNATSNQQSIDYSIGQSTRDDGTSDSSFVNTANNITSGQSYNPPTTTSYHHHSSSVASSQSNSNTTPQTTHNSVTKLTELNRIKLLNEAKEKLRQKQIERKQAAEFARKTTIQQYRLLQKGGYKGSYSDYLKGGVSISHKTRKKTNKPKKYTYYMGQSKRNDYHGQPKFVQRTFEQIDLSKINFSGVDVKPKNYGTQPRENMITFFSSKTKYTTPDVISNYNPNLINKLNFNLGKGINSKNQLTRSVASLGSFGLGTAQGIAGIGLGTAQMLVHPFKTITAQSLFVENLLTNQNARNKFGMNIYSRPAQSLGKMTGFVIGGKLINKGIRNIKNIKFENNIKIKNVDKSYTFDKTNKFTDISEQGNILRGQTQIKPKDFALIIVSSRA